MTELYELTPVKNEFLQNVGGEYMKSFTPQQMELAAYLLTDFCNNLEANGFLLARMDAQQQPMPPPPMPPVQNYAQQNPFQNESFVENEVAKNIMEMNTQLQRPTPRLQQPPSPILQQQDVNLQSEKPKSFVEKIREMRVGPTRKAGINPEE